MTSLRKSEADKVEGAGQGQVVSAGVRDKVARADCTVGVRWEWGKVRRKGRAPTAAARKHKRGEERGEKRDEREERI